MVQITISNGTKSKRIMNSQGPINFNINTDTIGYVKQRYCELVDNTVKPRQMRLYGIDGELDNDNETLFDAGIEGSVNLTLIFRVIGGALYVPDSSAILNSKRERKLNTSHPRVKLSNKPCDVYYIDDIPCALMPCGHSLCPAAMFNTVKHVVTTSKHNHSVLCPIGNCKRKFPFNLCAAVANFNDNEYLYFQSVFAKRAAPETKACPFCTSNNQRPRSLKKFRVNCVACSGGDWCFICAGKWHGGGFTVCGNSGCQSANINNVLKNCKNKKTTYKDSNNNYVVVPELRACPNCVAFIAHDDLCKHMDCPDCKHAFCFSCLTARLPNGSWPCGSHKDQCVVAKRQVLK